MRDACAEYVKRLGRFCRISVVQLDDESIGKDEEAVLHREGKRILDAISPTETVVAMTIDGKRYDSVALSKHMDGWKLDGKSNIAFVIGGSLGLAPEVLRRANETVSLSDMTFPHGLARVIILEQLYRGFKISANETYHK